MLHRAVADRVDRRIGGAALGSTVMPSSTAMPRVARQLDIGHRAGADQHQVGRMAAVVAHDMAGLEAAHGDAGADVHAFLAM